MNIINILVLRVWSHNHTIYFFMRFDCEIQNLKQFLYVFCDLWVSKVVDSSKLNIAQSQWGKLNPYALLHRVDLY